MIQFLSRRFIKDCDNADDPAVRRAYGVLCGCVGIALNVLLFGGKLLAGLATGSIAITADAANNLSDAAHLEGPSAAQLRNGDIVGLCRDIMDRARHPAELLDIRLDFQCEKERHTIAMDKDRIERMMLNLLSNAFKFIRRDEKLVTLDVRVSREWVELILTDTGCGISQELLETVFDRYRHTQRLDPPPHGLGLGLPVCRRIAQEHGGVLLLTSQEGTGTTVTVSLPNKRSKLQQMSTFLVDLGGGYNRTLAELSDALPSRAFTHQYMD